MIPCPIAHWKKHRPKALALPSMTYFELDELIQKLCKALSSTNPILSFAPQKSAPDIPLDIALFFATWRLKKAIYPLNPKLPTKEIEKRIKMTNSTWIELDKLPLLEKLDIPEIDESALATLIETSSATKIVCHTYQSHLISAQNAAKALSITSDSIYCLNLPLFHVSGLATLLRTFHACGQIIFQDQIEKATHVSMVSTQLHRLSEPLPKLKCLLLGGGPLPSGQSPYPIYRSYGMTETASMAFVKPPGEKTRPLPHIEYKLAPDGEVLMRGPSLFSHYYNHPPRDPLSWFATKDLAAMNNEQELTILGRKDRQFISGGENIQPEEIEKVLMEHPDILEAKIMPISDEEFGMRPIALIHARVPLPTDALKEWLKGDLPSYKIPIHFEIQTRPLESKLSKLS